VRDDLLVYGLPDGFSQPSFQDATLIGAEATQYQLHLRFDGHNRGVAIESRFAVLAPGGQAAEFTDPPAGAAALTAFIGARLQHAAGSPDGTLTLTFATGAKIVVFDDSTQYESYQIYDGERLIVV
jgi:hypothetical protein